MAILLLLIALAAPITSIRQHEGRAHFHPKERRQQPVSPFQGLGVLATSAPVAAASTTASTTPTISSYVFPTTVIQVSVATVCPDTPASSAIFPILPVSSLASVVGANTTQGWITNSSTYMPIRVNVTALLPNGNTTVFLSTSTTQVLPTTTTVTTPPLGPETARIVLDKNGCQTVYSAKTTAWCSTTVQAAGLLPVPVTDCDQLVTFSSQRLGGCSTTTPGSSPFGSSLSPVETNEPMAFYVAHWYDLIRGPIPSVVQVQDCLPLSTGWNCITSSESWDVVTATSTTRRDRLRNVDGHHHVILRIDSYDDHSDYFIRDQSTSARG
ncbi:hypothetical protein AYL99_06468 [Fonsecaea erecta]|uniref:Uncharacterized protein n=1 Tax=Fonsecaea erecta TaxID=1367422 RepID=A0A178ZHB2_9EURO|nr:hypothetical protein AYL99_06468 [Fonsecaea erecta]OAP59170.1 hypothetical protein AYL99_06468 [Fonsecaea erecta]